MDRREYKVEEVYISGGFYNFIANYQNEMVIRKIKWNQEENGNQKKDSLTIKR